ncbi:MAG: sigma-70 family RNA polymerase sigma factor [bacterium]|nr:sigma-70 family RNA polymerase sigma factor [bacterium]
MLACLPKLKAFAISLSHDEDQAEDLVQQTLLQSLAKIDSFELGSNMSAWLFTILRNAFISDYRKYRREVEWNPEFEDALFFSTRAGEAEAEATYDLHQLLLYLACLPAEQSDALVAISYLGMSYEEAAERLDCAVGTIKSRVSRARSALLALLDESAIKQVDLSKLKTATRGVPQSHKYYPIVKAYEELYAACEEVSDRSNGSPESAKEAAAPSEKERLWQELVASGALDDDHESLDSLMQGGPDEP